MIEWIVRQLFRWPSLRSELFAEVGMYNMLKRLDLDPDSKKIAAAYWDEGDGWRGWTHNSDLNKYYFNDIPEHSFGDAMHALDDMEGTIRL